MMSQISIFKRLMAGCLLLLTGTATFAFSWQDLWVTKDKQAEKLMAEGQFRQAQTYFNDPAWQAVAAFRAKNYESATKGFEALGNENGYYNQGNALAHMGKYEAAIKAYDKALSINPANEDALYNRKLVESLLQKEKQQQKSSSNDKKSSEQNSQKDNQSSTNKDDQSVGKEQQNSSQSENQENQKPSEQKDNSNNSEESQQSTQDKKAEKDKESAANKADKSQKKDNSKADKSPAETKTSSEEREKQQAKEQLLRLIPDDPGGLLREKFLRDYIKRQRGWYQ